MKTIISKLLLFLSAFLLITGCSSQGSRWRQWIRETEKTRVLCTTAMIHDLVSEIGGDRVYSLPLIQGELDPHSYQLVKGDDEKLASAELIFYNGLGLEHGASLAHCLSNHPAAIALGNRIFEENPKDILWVDGTIDPHIWMDISLWMKAIDPITQALSKNDPASKDLFEANAASLKAEMQKAHLEILHRLHQIPEAKRYLVTSHDAFNYFAKRYLSAPHEIDSDLWQKRFEAPEGLAPEGQLSPLDLQRIISHLQEYDIHVIFPESNVSHASIEKIVDAGREKGLHLKISKKHLYGDAMMPSNKEGATYLETMRHNADIICSQMGDDSNDYSTAAHRTL